MVELEEPFLVSVMDFRRVRPFVLRSVSAETIESSSELPELRVSDAHPLIGFRFLLLTDASFESFCFRLVLVVGAFTRAFGLVMTDLARDDDPDCPKRVIHRTQNKRS